MAARRHRVLVVDDEPGLRLLLERVLIRGGYEVRVAESLASAQSDLFEVDAIVTDYNLGGGVTGADVVRAAREGMGSTAPPALLVTATPDDVPHHERKLFVDILAKPFRLPVLTDAMRVMLADRRPRLRSSIEARPLGVVLADLEGTGE